MKGIVFTEFLDMVEKEYGYELVDQMINECDLSSGGVYTSVGTYDHAEIVSLVSWLSNYSGVSVPELLRQYGKYLHNTFVANYGHFFDQEKDCFSFLESIDQYIHIEVQKIYPDAELPTFETKRINEHCLEMIYRSKRKMSDFASGLIEKSLEYYGEKASLERVFIEPDGSVVKFVITKFQS